MGRLIWAALVAALAVTCASGAQAAVVYSTSGVFCGDETRAPQPDATFQATTTGYIGTFSVKDNTDVTSPATWLGQDGLLRRQDVYATGVTIYANVNGSQVPYAFTLSRIDAVPEPSAWAMMLLGFSGVGVALRRRRMATA